MFEEQRVEHLDVAVRRQGAAVLDDLLVGRELRMEPLGKRGPGHGDAERLSGLDGGDAGFAQPGDGAQRVGTHGEDPGGRSEGVEQDRCELRGLGDGV